MILTVARIELRKIFLQRALPAALVLATAAAFAFAAAARAAIAGDLLEEGVDANGFLVLARGGRDAVVLAGLLCYLAAATSLAGEAERGQLRPLLVRPVARGTLYAGRLIAFCVIGVGAVAFAFVAGALVGALTGGFGDVADPLLQGDAYGAPALWADVAQGFLLAACAIVAAIALGSCVSALARGAAGAGVAGLLLALVLAIAGAAFEPLEAWLPSTSLWRPLDETAKLAVGTSLFREAGAAPQAALLLLAVAALATAVGATVFARRDHPQ